MVDYDWQRSAPDAPPPSLPIYRAVSLHRLRGYVNAPDTLIHYHNLPSDSSEAHRVETGSHSADDYLEENAVMWRETRDLSRDPVDTGRALVTGMASGMASGMVSGMVEPFAFHRDTLKDGIL